MVAGEADEDILRETEEALIGMRCVWTEQMCVEIEWRDACCSIAPARPWWPAERTLIFADLHFEKGCSYAGAAAVPAAL